MVAIRHDQDEFDNSVEERGWKNRTWKYCSPCYCCGGEQSEPASPTNLMAGTPEWNTARYKNNSEGSYVHSHVVNANNSAPPGYIEPYVTINSHPMMYSIAKRHREQSFRDGSLWRNPSQASFVTAMSSDPPTHLRRRASNAERSSFADEFENPIEGEDTILLAQFKAEAHRLQESHNSRQPPKISKHKALELYKFFKQAVAGDAPRNPRMGSDNVMKSMHAAWSECRGMPREDAMRKYIRVCQRVVPY